MPLDILPDLSIRSQSMMPIRRTKINRSRGRAVQAQEDAFYHWEASFQTASQTAAMDAAYMDSMLAIGAGGELFRCYDLLRERPGVHNDGSPLSGDRALGGAFDGTATIDTIVDGFNVSISGLPDGFELSRGDYIEFRMSADFLMLTTIAVGVVAGSNGLADVELRYPIDTQNFTSAGIVNFERASCLMQRIEAANRSASDHFSKGSFSAQEVPYK